MGVLGTLISLVGLALTYRQAKRAANAAALARDEVARAVNLIRSRSRLAALSSAVSRADLLMERIERDALTSSPEMLTEFRRLMKEAFAGGNHPPEGNIVIDAKLEELSRLVYTKVELKTKRTTMIGIFEDVRTQLIAHEAQARMEFDR